MITVEMFKDYKEEDMRFLNLYGRDSVYDRSLASQIENDVDILSEDDRNKIIYMVFPTFEDYKNLIASFRVDKKNGSIKGKDNLYGTWKPYFGSIKAWRKRHNLAVYSWDDADDLMYIVSYKRWSVFNTALKLDADLEQLDRFIKNYICQYIFMNTKRELEYFKEHDEYYVLAHKLDERNTYDDFNDYYFYEVDGVAYKISNEDNRNNRKATEMTLEELKAVNAFFDKLDNAVNMLISKSFSEFPIDK